MHCLNTCLGELRKATKRLRICLLPVLARLESRTCQIEIRSFTARVNFLGRTEVRISFPFIGLDKPLGLQEVEAPRISGHSAHEGGKVVSLTHRPHLPPGDTHGTHFC